MFREMYVIQDSVSRQFGEPFVSFNDDTVRRIMYPNFAYQSAEHPEVLDGVVLAIAAVNITDDAYTVEPYIVPRRVCCGHDAEVSAIVRQLSQQVSSIPDENEVTVDA